MRLTIWTTVLGTMCLCLGVGAAVADVSCGGGDGWCWVNIWTAPCGGDGTCQPITAVCQNETLQPRYMILTFPLGSYWRSYADSWEEGKTCTNRLKVCGTRTIYRSQTVGGICLDQCNQWTPLSCLLDSGDPCTP